MIWEAYLNFQVILEFRIIKKIWCLSTDYLPAQVKQPKIGSYCKILEFVIGENSNFTFDSSFVFTSFSQIKHFFFLFYCPLREFHLSLS